MLAPSYWYTYPLPIDKNWQMFNRNALDIYSTITLNFFWLQYKQGFFPACAKFLLEVWQGRLMISCLFSICSNASIYLANNHLLVCLRASFVQFFFFFFAVYDFFPQSTRFLAHSLPSFLPTIFLVSCSLSSSHLAPHSSLSFIVPLPILPLYFPPHRHTLSGQ